MAKGTSASGVKFAGVAESVSAAAISDAFGPRPRVHGKARRRRHRLLRDGERTPEVALLRGVTHASTVTDPKRLGKRASANSMHSACCHDVRVLGAYRGGLAPLNVRAPGDLGKKHIGSSGSSRASNLRRKSKDLDLNRSSEANKSDCGRRHRPTGTSQVENPGPGWAKSAPGP